MPDITGDYIFVFNWTSGNEKIDDFIQKERLKINHCCDGDVVFEWIPYNQFFEIKETNKNGFITVYSAIWKNGPLYKKVNMHGSKSYTRDSNNKVALKCLHNSQESIDSLINEAKKYPTNHKEFQVLYGISQNPDTGNYILVQNNSINMLNWFSGNEKVDEFIQEKQLKINNYDIVPEWIPYNQFFEIKETKTNGLITVYSAIWKNGPLCCNYDARRSDKKVALKYLHNSQKSIDYLINEAKKYPTNHKEFQVLYGISQNPDTGNYILVQNNSINMLNWFSGNEKVDDFIQERQLKINNYYNVVPEWIPYNQFNEIRVIDTNGFITVYSAIWKDGPLYKEIDTWDICNDDKNYARDSDKKVALICLHNSQASIEFLLNKVKYLNI
ncbi:kinase-like domain-containing protein [Rhizophagus irregularis DAOM 181602=DAOM 197198]|nr:kinase-like domain-containing protein [Rhizophagus irregularis DAOM 181602=DAOM 197198]